MCDGTTKARVSLWPLAITWGLLESSIDTAVETLPSPWDTFNRFVDAPTSVAALLLIRVSTGQGRAVRTDEEVKMKTKRPNVNWNSKKPGKNTRR